MFNGTFRTKQTVENHKFSHPRVFNAPVEGVLLGIGWGTLTLRVTYSFLLCNSNFVFKTMISLSMTLSDL